MKLAIGLSVLLLVIGGCFAAVKDDPGLVVNDTMGRDISGEKPAPDGVRPLLFSEEDMALFDLVGNGSDCVIESFQTGENSPVTETGTCFYVLKSLTETELVVQLWQFAGFDELNGTYQYSSQHLRSREGLLSEDEFGQMSRFYVNSDKDYGAEFNEPGVFFYSLWIAKEPFLIHVTTRGDEGAREVIPDIGRLILSKAG